MTEKNIRYDKNPPFGWAPGKTEASPTVLVCGEPTEFTFDYIAEAEGVATGGSVILIYTDAFYPESMDFPRTVEVISDEAVEVEELPCPIEGGNPLLRACGGKLPPTGKLADLRKYVGRDVFFRDFVCEKHNLYLHYCVTKGQLKAGDRLRVTFTLPVKDYEIEDENLIVWADVDGTDDFKPIRPDEFPRVTIVAGAPSRLRLVAPSVVRPGETFTVRMMVLDSTNNPPRETYVGKLQLVTGTAAPISITLRKADRGRTEATRMFNKEGEQLLTLSGEGLETTRLPILCSPCASRVYWGMLHEAAHRAAAGGGFHSTGKLFPPDQ